MFFEELQKRVAEKNVLILGVGDRQRGDHGVGSILVERLIEKQLDLPLIDAGDVPENFLKPIETSGADLVLVIDAADLGGQPGDISLLELNTLKQFGVATHTVNLGLLFRVIPKSRRPDVLLLAIQPEITEAGLGLSRSVDIAMKGLEKLLLQLFKE
ncbi:MAG: hypothetical protein Kow002_16970 [Anaerolineales bacterium]